MANRAVVMAKTRLCSIGDIVSIDACLDESHTLNNNVTDHPVEEGGNISDHCRPEADMVTLRCFISNTPISREQKTRAIKEGSFQFDTTAADPTKIGAVDGRGDQAFRKLKKMRDEGTLIKLVTSLKTYNLTSTEGMIIQNLTFPRTSKNYDGLEFSATFKQIRIVKNKQTKDVKSKDPRRAPKKKTGAQGTKPADEELKSASYSLSESASESGNTSLQGAGNFFLKR